MYTIKITIVVIYIYLYMYLQITLHSLGKYLLVIKVK